MPTKMGNVNYKNIIGDLGMLIQKIEEWNKLLIILKSQMILSTPKQSEYSTVPRVHSFVGYEKLSFVLKRWVFKDAPSVLKRVNNKLINSYLTS